MIRKKKPIPAKKTKAYKPGQQAKPKKVSTSQASKPPTPIQTRKSIRINPEQHPKVIAPLGAAFRAQELRAHLDPTGLSSGGSSLSSRELSSLVHIPGPRPPVGINSGDGRQAPKPVSNAILPQNQPAHPDVASPAGPSRALPAPKMNFFWERPGPFRPTGFKSLDVREAPGASSAVSGGLVAPVPLALSCTARQAVLPDALTFGLTQATLSGDREAATHDACKVFQQASASKALKGFRAWLRELNRIAFPEDFQFKARASPEPSGRVMNFSFESRVSQSRQDQREDLNTSVWADFNPGDTGDFGDEAWGN